MKRFALALALALATLTSCAQSTPSPPPRAGSTPAADTPSTEAPGATSAGGMVSGPASAAAGATLGPASAAAGATLGPAGAALGSTPTAAGSEAAPGGPPYDLAADLDARTKGLRAEVGARTKFEIVEDVFLVAAPSGSLGGSAAVARKALEAYFNGRFARRPARAVAVLLFDSAPPYRAYCEARWGEPCPSPFGFYASDSRTVVMNAGPGIGTLTHELVHPIVETDFPGAPDWINEGLASLYEAFSMPKPGDIRGHKNWRHPALLAALSSRKGREHANLPALFTMSDREFRGDREALNYASARYFCQWMDGQKKLWPFYQAWRDGHEHDPTGEKAFLATMGKGPADLDAEWAAWVRAL